MAKKISIKTEYGKVLNLTEEQIAHNAYMYNVSSGGTVDYALYMDLKACYEYALTNNIAPNRPKGW